MRIRVLGSRFLASASIFRSYYNIKNLETRSAILVMEGTITWERTLLRLLMLDLSPIPFSPLSFPSLSALSSSSFPKIHSLSHSSSINDFYQRIKKVFLPLAQWLQDEHGDMWPQLLVKRLVRKKLKIQAKITSQL